MRFAPLPLAAALGAVLLGGCTNIGAPLPTDFAQEPQQKIQAVRQWQTVATSLAERLSVMMIRDNSCTPQATLCDVIYVHPAANASTFDAAFRDAFVSYLVGRGWNVAQQGPADIEIDLDSRYAKLATAPDVEVMVTASARRGDRYLARISDVYYVTSPELYAKLASTPPYDPTRLTVKGD